MIGWIAKIVQKRKLDKYAKYWGHRKDWPLCVKCNEPMEKAEDMIVDLGDLDIGLEQLGMDGFRCVADKFIFVRLASG